MRFARISYQIAGSHWKCSSHHQVFFLPQFSLSLLFSHVQNLMIFFPFPFEKSRFDGKIILHYIPSVVLLPMLRAWGGGTRRVCVFNGNKKKKKTSRNYECSARSAWSIDFWLGWLCCRCRSCVKKKSYEQKKYLVLFFFVFWSSHPTEAFIFFFFSEIFWRTTYSHTRTHM